LPSEFPPEIAMGLHANIPAIEAANAMELARGIAIAMGDSKTLAHAVYLSTGNDRLAMNIEISAEKAKHHAKHG
jgi:hypothetical protein